MQRNDLLIIYVDGSKCNNFSKKMGIKEISVALLLHNAKIVKRAYGNLDQIIDKVSEVLSELK